MDRIYLVDTNVFITARDQYYSFRICPGFWDGIIQYHQKGGIFSIDRVRRELLARPTTEDLFQWVNTELPQKFFFSSYSDEVMQAYNEIMLWVNQNPQYFKRAKLKFGRGADGWLVACAWVKSAVVVTNEASAPAAKKVIKIPDVCSQFGVRCEDTFSMLHSLNIQFDLREAGQ